MESFAERPGAAGHRRVPHTADVRLEAWAPSRERCVAEAVAGMVGGFADVSGAAPVETTELRIEPPAGARMSDEDLLVAVLDEVIYLMDTAGRLPVRTTVEAAGPGLRVRLELADTRELTGIGAVPKAVSLHELRFSGTGAGWWCAVTLDV